MAFKIAFTVREDSGDKVLAEGDREARYHSRISAQHGLYRVRAKARGQAACRAAVLDDTRMICTVYFRGGSIEYRVERA